MPPFVIAVLIMVATAVVAVSLGLLLVYTQSGVTPRQWWANLREPWRLSKFRRNHPQDYAAYQQHSFWRYADVADLHARGWTARTLRDLDFAFRATKFFEDRLHGSAGFSAGCRCDQCRTGGGNWTKRRIIEVLSGHAFALYDQHPEDLPQRNNPAELQRRYDAHGHLAPLTLMAGLGEDEARALAADGRLDADTLRAMAALRAGAAAPSSRG